jgi:multidrug resistance efflux pump
MIIFLTICYCAFLFILVKIGVIKLNSFWKASPLIWVTLLLIFLFIPMNWGAPAGPATLYQFVVSVTPNVSGEVTEVTAVSNSPTAKGDVLFKIDPTQYQAAVDQLEANLALSKQRLDQSQRLARRGAGSQYDVERYQAEVKATEAQLANARWNLDSCVVTAPADGFPIGVTLEPGARVSNMSSPLAYVISTRKMLAGIDQIFIRHIEPGQPVEVVMKVLPGKVLTGTVEGLAMMTPQGQLAPSGAVPQAPTGQQPPAPFGVVVVPDEASLALIDELGMLPGGATGTAAIYTESAKFSHLIRKVTLRLEMWMNFVNPF